MIYQSNDNMLNSIFEIANIHAKRLSYAYNKLNHAFPLNSTKILAITEDEMPMYDLLTNRFSKLQDYMGQTIFPKLLIAGGESIDEMTFIDRLNHLEKLGVVNNAATWMQMRQIRNHLAHEYPHQPAQTAEYLNQAYQYTQELLSILDQTIKFAYKHGILK